jgi:protein subunit release factor A
MDIEPAAKLLATYRDNARQLEEAVQILADPTAGAEFHKMAMEESATLERQQREIEQQAQELLIPKDPRDEKNLLLEIRAGTGGDEAALFAGALFRMYSKYAEIKGSRSMWSKPQKQRAEATRGSLRLSKARAHTATSNSRLESTGYSVFPSLRPVGGFTRRP